jgi:DNA-binding NtrC family response regulator
MGQEPPISTASLAGCRVLVVEDEMLVGMTVEDALVDAGCEVVGPVGQVDKALALLVEDARLDAAVMDMNLGGQSADPVAEALTLRRIPFVILTGYGTMSLPESYPHARVLSKPTDPGLLTRAVRRVIDAAADRRGSA